MNGGMDATQQMIVIPSEVEAVFREFLSSAYPETGRFFDLNDD
jgi:hypothetical protein